jgi:hypothetical protein
MGNIKVVDDGGKKVISTRMSLKLEFMRSGFDGETGATIVCVGFSEPRQ